MNGCGRSVYLASAGGVLRIESLRAKEELQGLATVDDEGFTPVEAADVVGVDVVAVPGALAAEAGVVQGVGLLGPFQHPLRSGQGGDVVGAEAGSGLGDEDDGHIEAAGPLDQVDGGAGPVGLPHARAGGGRGLRAPRHESCHP
jgi:hypothetical protein